MEPIVTHIVEYCIVNFDWILCIHIVLHPFYCMRFYEMYFVRNDELKILNQSINETLDKMKAWIEAEILYMKHHSWFYVARDS